jgi:hypothetical protein
VQRSTSNAIFHFGLFVGIRTSAMYGSGLQLASAVFSKACERADGFLCA